MQYAIMIVEIIQSFETLQIVVRLLGHNAKLGSKLADKGYSVPNCIMVFLC